VSVKTYSTVWDLESVFSGGSESPELASFMNEVSSKIEAFKEKVSTFTIPTSLNEKNEIASIIDDVKVITQHLRQAGAFIGCLEAQNSKDTYAGVLRSKMMTLSASFQNPFLDFQLALANMNESLWTEMMKDEFLSEFSFVLNEWRKKAKEKLSNKEEALIQSLAIDGYHGWGQMYDVIVGSMNLSVDLDGKAQTLSVGQANNLTSHPKSEVRKQIFEKLEEAWSEKEELFAETLNHLSGFRLQLYKARGWESFLKEPLEYNRMEEKTLNAMWGAIAKRKSKFVEYLDQKASMLGKEKMDWEDLDAPMSQSNTTMSYQDGADFILHHFSQFGDKLAQFTEKAFEESWIEAEDRPGKRPGGFCTSLPLSEQSRIFMTYSGTMSNVSTLAHELGHAFHSYALKPVHALNRNYAMNVAETASTFAEMIVSDAAVKAATSKEEKISLLEDKIQRSVAFFMNIHARFLFETSFYKERKQGVVPAKRLNELMEEAQKEAYAGGLNQTHPHFWASKLHFYISGVPFYNFPYTFGYLFSLSLYARAIEEGKAYEEKYLDLLRDTAIMNVEDLAMKHLGEDITEEAFWVKGIELCERDVEEFLELVKE
jgi:oligoendopeptidase F